ncbi:MAG: hypothetical protein HC852_23735 [Acaryochloridaceae cyanobacterium RU_4_10]|nr:hypothetical protein [Acaryochloridaceae cyanobacterium RU_4_10]
MLRKLILATLEDTRSVLCYQKTGFALPLAMMLGLIMLAIAGTSLLVAQGDRDNAEQRKTSGASLLVSDGAISRALLELNKPNNGVLLIRDYDPTDPKTGKNYLGPDGRSKSGDESTTAVDRWTGYDPSSAPCFQQLGRTTPSVALTGTIGANETYTIRAYRYDKQNKEGTLLVEGNYKGQSSLVAVTLSIEPVLDDFPGILLFDSTPTDIWKGGVLALRGRQILGRKGNVYYVPSNSADSSLTSISQPGDTNRSSYLNAVWSSTANDGASADTVEGKFFACSLTPNIPASGTGTDSGVIKKTTTLSGVGGTVPTLFQVDKIDLENNEILTVDTTGGPVQIDITDNGSPGNNPDKAITLRNSAKIINSRTDGQPPRVGDLRIMLHGNSQTNLYDRTCIQNAFLYSFRDELRILTSGSGCSSGRNTNFEGVVWTQAVLSSKNAVGNRNVNYLTGNTGTQYDTTITAGAKSGIAVPEDVSSLSDLLEYVDWPVRYRYGSIKNWQRVN